MEIHAANPNDPPRVVTAAGASNRRSARVTRASSSVTSTPATGENAATAAVTSTGTLSSAGLLLAQAEGRSTLSVTPGMAALTGQMGVIRAMPMALA